MNTTEDRIDQYGTDPEKWAAGYIEAADRAGPIDPVERRDFVRSWFADALTAGAGDLGAVDYGDSEVTAMGQLLQVLEDLNEEARRRALKWVGERLGFEMEVRG